MKRFLSSIAMTLLLSIGATTSMTAADSDSLLLKQRDECGLVIRYSIVLSQEKDVPTLVETRKQLRKVLEEMRQKASLLTSDEKLKAHKDYLLSIEEGLTQLSRLAEEPMTPANLEQVKEMCAFITVVDQQLLESLDAPAGKSYQASR
jgi:hypothetical protein